MAVRKPGQNDATGAGDRNRRVNRFDAAGDNDPFERHVLELEDTTIAFVAPNQITDSGNRLDRFEVNSIIEISGSAAEDGQYQVLTSAPGALTVVEGGIASVIAGPSITIASKNNRNRNRFSSLVA